MTEKKPDKIKITQKLTKDLLDKMGVNAGVDVTQDKDNELLNVELESTEEKGLLIGKKGETINAIQVILGLMLRQKLGEWYRVQVNIGDWRVKQEEYLNTLADKTAQRAKETGQPQSLYNLNATQRRVVHLRIAEIEGVASESVGEGRERCLIIKPDK